MKISCFSVLFFFCAIFTCNEEVNAQSSWKPLGGAGGLVSDTAITRSLAPSIATDTSDVPYISYTAVSDSATLIIKKFDGTNWINVGNLGYHLRGGLPFMVISPYNTIYVAFYNYNDSGKYSVIKFDGTNWVQIGNSIPKAPGSYWETSLAVDSNEKLYFGYAAYSYLSNPPGKANIMTFDGTDWVPVGNTSFVQYTGRISLRIGLNNELYVGYNTYYLTGNSPINSWVQKYNGISWDTVGQGFRYITNIDIAPDGTVYVLHEGGVSDWWQVDKLVNNTWVALGNTGIPGFGWELAVDDEGVPHIVFGSAVERYDGSSWYVLGNAPVNNFGIRDCRLAFSKGTPIVTGYSTTAALNEKVYAYYYDSVLVNGVPSITENNKLKIYPNPVSGRQINIEANELKKGAYSVQLFNEIGQMVYESSYTHNGREAGIRIDLKKELSNGIYHLNISNEQSRFAGTVVVER